MTTWSTTEQTVTWTSTAGTTWQVVRGSTGGGGGGGASALNDLTDVDTATDPPATDDVLAWDGVTWTPATLTALGAPGLSNATPADLGTAAAGVSTEASRADHVHDMPTAAQVGALPDNTALLALGETSTTAYRGDRGKTAYDHSQVVTGNPHGTTVGDISGFDEQVRDVIGSALVAGGGITITPNDGADTITIVSAAVLPTIRKPIDATLDAPMLVMGQGWSGGRGYADRTANRIYYTFFTVHTETVVDAYLWGTEGAFAATVYFGIIACTRDGVPASVVHQSNQAVSGASSRIDTFTPVTLQPGNYAIFDVGNNNWRGSYQPTYVPTARRASVPFEYAHYASFTAGPVSGTPPAPTACTAGVSVQSDTVPTITLRRKAL